MYDRSLKSNYYAIFLNIAVLSQLTRLRAYPLFRSKIKATSDKVAKVKTLASVEIIIAKATWETKSKLRYVLARDLHSRIRIWHPLGNDAPHAAHTITRPARRAARIRG